jgi:hypothetical protein
MTHASGIIAFMNSSSGAGGNVYVGPSLTSSLIRFVAALAAAQR